MNAFFKHIVQDKILLYSFSLGVFFLVISLAYVLFVYHLFPPLIPVFNQLPWGDARVSQKQFIFMPIISVLIVAIVNLALSFYIYKKIPLLSRILSMTFLMDSLLVFIFIVRIIQLII